MIGPIFVCSHNGWFVTVRLKDTPEQYYVAKHPLYRVRTGKNLAKLLKRLEK